MAARIQEYHQARPRSSIYFYLTWSIFAALFLCFTGAITISFWRTVLAGVAPEISLKDQSRVDLKAAVFFARGGVHIVCSPSASHVFGTAALNWRRLLGGNLTFSGLCELFPDPAYPRLSASVRGRAASEWLGVGFGIISVDSHFPRSTYRATGFELVFPGTLALAFIAVSTIGNFLYRQRKGVATALQKGSLN
jgi:hypothetical protein